jgi:hypothetical protein
MTSKCFTTIWILRSYWARSARSRKGISAQDLPGLWDSIRCILFQSRDSIFAKGFLVNTWTLPCSPRTMRRRYQKRGLRTPQSPWEHFDSVRTKETGGDCKLLLNHVSLTVPGPWTHRDAVEAIAKQSQMPIAIHSLADVLSQRSLSRGKVIFGFVGDEIDKIADQYEDMRWWISKDGLNMAIVTPALARLSGFDELAGKLYVEMSQDGKLSKEILTVIAQRLDLAEFTLKEQLQPAQWKAIARHNQKYAREAIKTFARACQHRISKHSIRKRLYVARDRYMAANSSR